MGPRVGPPAELDGGVLHGGEPAVEAGGVGVEVLADEGPPPVDALVVGGHGVGLGADAPDEVGVDAQERPPAVGGELGGEGADEGAGEEAEVARALGLVAVEQGVAGLVDGWRVAGEHGGEDAGPVAEVVLDGDGVAGPRLAVDLPQADGVDAPLGEEALGGVEQVLPGAQWSAASRSRTWASLARAAARTDGRWALGQRPSTGA